MQQKQMKSRNELLKLNIIKNQDIIWYAFCDASFNSTDGSSRSGAAFYLSYESGAFSYFSKMEENVSPSPMEAEVRSIHRTMMKIKGYRNLLEEMGHKQLNPTIIYTDSEATVKYFLHYKNSKRLKNVFKLLNEIRDAINKKEIILVFIRSEYNVADGLTKLLIKANFIQFLEWILYGYNETHLKNYLHQSQLKH